MLVVTVDFVVAPDFIDAFRIEMLGNAQASLSREPGCRRFDVAFSDEDSSKVFLYELYDDRAAFEAHQETEHFRRFDARTSPWVVSKLARTFRLIDPV
jgi:autoinducer 2-degrading protein